LKLIGGKTVSLKCDKTDRYKREVCTIYLNYLDANLALVKAGLACHYKKYSFEQFIFDRKRYSSSEVIARKSKKGLWI
jgi:endonuclease YncB( thermonuclease family)